MGELGRRFQRHMVLRGFAEATKESYTGAMLGLFRAYGGTPPDQLTCDQVQAHIARLIGERHLSWNTVNVHVCAFNNVLSLAPRLSLCQTLFQRHCMVYPPRKG